MHYHISVTDPASHFLIITYTIPEITTDRIEIQLPAWRPGRYEIQNFAKNIQFIEAISISGDKLPIRKITKDRWEINTNNEKEVQIRYSYYAAIQNAGSSYVDEELWYLNFINFCFYTEGRINDEYRITLALPETFKIASGLASDGLNKLIARDFYQLVDSPLLASETLQKSDYTVRGVQFHIWMHGRLKPNWKRIQRDFRRFSREQIATMGDFPEEEYHFLNLILPHAFYHGVEHHNSTMIVLGPDDEGEGLYTDLLGVSSHELFHAWNIIRIRPVELLPYDFTKENYFETCFVAEGCTTYYGDLFLKRAGVFNDEAYVKELQVYMKRHFENSASAAQSLAQSSFDLWLDGYEKGIPHRKVSVYHKGALVAMILDLYLRKKSNHEVSLDTVMQILWQRFGKPFIGYTIEDYQNIVEEVADEKLDWYWQDCIFTNEPLETRLNEALSFVGLQMTTFSNGNIQLNVQDDFKAKIQRDKWLETRQILSDEEEE
ncbi:Predicted metalloprotease, contains C-terminal PDZ domain [Dyadobacter koreensis]|uniref:Predicted metalloprotease, contains C-terminal PDZ domain n=1 Tax=Dyadobacter koreensis TaxID=408657 RepID=A0A1H6WL90_9BACT|nr:M61 family metallopeptidase [Dyadobacter koreensis]SEJ15964.1 Predicted metalloprotease, contains C-terminal PDZ domain [Dyadobacter koreensis]